MIATSAFLILLVIASSIAISRRASGARVLIIGTSPLARQLVAEIGARHGGRYHVVGVVNDVNEPDLPVASLLAGPLASLGSIIEDLRPDRIVLALSDRRGRLPMRELLEAHVQGVVVEDGVECYERLTGKIAIEALTPSCLIASGDFRKRHMDLAFGHALSLLVSLTAIIVLAPLFALVVLAIKLDSPGPVFFVHDRIGLRGRRLKLLKFRTMRAADGPTSEWVRDNGHRITRVGKWLRRFRLDELPQLINVLRGEMNLIGPRPHPESNFELFAKEIPYYSLRSAVRPGLTGWAQVRQGYANGLEEETEKMRYDLYYIKHMSAWLDLGILLQTVQIVLSGHKSSAVPEKEPCSAYVRPSARVSLEIFQSSRTLAASRAAKMAILSAKRRRV
jgi:exopolysaccharide biosynthesis polyprenyl glycosylphosphotransferase